MRDTKIARIAILLECVENMYQRGVGIEGLFRALAPLESLAANSTIFEILQEL